MSKPFFHNPSECNKLHPPPFAREAKRLIYFYSARFSHFIDSLKGGSDEPPFIISPQQNRKAAGENRRPLKNFS